MRMRFLVSGLIAATALIGNASAQGMGQPESVAALTTRSCTPIEVGDFQNRIHVRCSTAVNSISFYALATNDNNRAARVLAILSGAWLGGHNLTIWYDPADLSGASLGCQNADCRLLVWAAAN